MTDEPTKDVSVYKLMPASGGDHAARAGATQYALDKGLLTDPEVHSVALMGPWLHVRVVGFPVPKAADALDLEGMLTESRQPRKRGVRRKR